MQVGARKARCVGHRPARAARHMPRQALSLHVLPSSSSSTASFPEDGPAIPHRIHHERCRCALRSVMDYARST
ncbi:Hypothetical protein CAP_2653 [Chondromyces apiculatus DSM 436]|uniref:Uncharacterized protein n=1 Tax=Chondromyces apiculatus DSM 436 TaxID=1192034 RepID=A0A017TIR5_9BACT|nr:Hypothetical protein CAP_2653 [Chondromyces apiculatus DSM 436]